MMLANLSCRHSSGEWRRHRQQEYRSARAARLLENFVSSSDELAYATLLNSDAKGISAGRIAPDAFLQRELQHAYDAAPRWTRLQWAGSAVEDGKASRTVVLVSSPLATAAVF